MGFLKLEGFFVLSSPVQLETLSLSYLLKEKDTNKVPKNQTFQATKGIFFFLTRILVTNEFNELV